MKACCSVMVLACLLPAALAIDNGLVRGVHLQSCVRPPTDRQFPLETDNQGRTPPMGWRRCVMHIATNDPMFKNKRNQKQLELLPR